MANKEIIIGKADLDRMTRQQLTHLLMAASEIRATAVVMDKDGRIKYDDPAKAGTFGEEHLNHG